MRVLRRLLAFFLAHGLAALAIAVSSWDNWVEIVVYSIPLGVFFAIAGLPYLLLEIPWAVTLFVTLDRCTRPWMRILVTIAAVLLFSWIGSVLTITPELATGYLAAGALFASTISLAAVWTRPRPGSNGAAPPEPETQGPPAVQ